MKMSRLATLSALALAFCQSLLYPVWADEYALVCQIAIGDDSKKVVVATADGEIEKEDKEKDLFIPAINDMINDGFEPVGGVAIAVLTLGAGMVTCQALYDD